MLLNPGSYGSLGLTNIGSWAILTLELIYSSSSKVRGVESLGETRAFLMVLVDLKKVFTPALSKTCSNCWDIP